jgi:hypothetical protein
MSVAQKIVLVMRDVGCLSKDKKLEGGQAYRYLSEERVTAELHESCAKHGLAIVPSGMAILETRIDKTRNDSNMFVVRIAASYRLMDSDEPDSFIDVQVLGEGSDMGDKALAKCQTNALKYMLRQSFLISSGDDPDHTASEETRHTPAQPQPQAQTPRQTAPAAATSDGTYPATKQGLWKCLNDVGWIKDDEQGKPMADANFWRIVKKLDFSSKYSTWTGEQYSAAIAEITAAVAPPPPAPADDGLPEDPFAVTQEVAADPMTGDPI